MEISLTDARTIGSARPYGNPAMWREAAAVTGRPQGNGYSEGRVAAKRHIHTTPEDAKDTV